MPFASPTDPYHDVGQHADLGLGWDEFVDDDDE
jgi:hypothetical protein